MEQGADHFAEMATAALSLVNLDFHSSSGLLENGHLPRFPHPSSLRRTAKYASFLRISGALHLTIFEQPEKDDFFSSLLIRVSLTSLS
jgi:hypothetical protein